VPSVFFAFRDAPERRAALRSPGALDRYRLFGLDEIRARGVDVQHNLERDGRPPLWARLLGKLANALVDAVGGYGGDFASAFASLRTANRADVVFATADTLAIPLLLLKRAGLLRAPVVYTPIGLPERLAQVRRQRLYSGALRRAHTIVSYSRAEAEWLRRWIGGGNVVFVPFGVDTDAFRPGDGAPDIDVVAVGADPRRDFELLKTVALRRRELSFRIVATKDQIAALGALPGQIATESDISLEEVRDRLSRARVVALPVRPNSYSGATTVLLQAMALAKPVVVSRTEAIAEGYGLQDGINCRLVEPGDADAFERALLDVLAGPCDLGANARQTVERDFGWERYIDALWDILSRAWEREPS
jgi:glycosyltransferase involved in cell wall biosynthesis